MSNSFHYVTDDDISVIYACDGTKLKKEVWPIVGLPRHKHFNVPLQAPFLQSFRETGHLFHAVGSFGRKHSTAIKSIELLAQEATPILVASFDAHGDTEYKFFPPGSSWARQHNSNEL